MQQFPCATARELNECLRQVGEEAKIRFPGSTINISSNSFRTTDSTRVSVTTFERIASNLIYNSLEASLPSGTSVEAKLQIGSGELVLRVEDNGKGIPSHLLKRIGEEGFTFGKSNGNGLGLYYVFQVCKQLGGQIEISSEEGRGTKVTLRLGGPVDKSIPS